MDKALSQEEVFADDKDPIEAIMEIRREEGVAEEDLPDLESDDTVGEPKADKADENDGEDELDELEEDDKSDDASDDEPDPDSETSDGEMGQEEETDEDDTASEEKNDEEQEKTPVIKKFKANGQEFEFTDNEIMEQFEQVFGKAMDYTQKMQQIAPFRKMISALETEGVTSEQLNTAIDALKGNKDALKDLLEKNNIDPYDLADDEETGKNPYQPTDYGKNDVQLNIEEVARAISSDPEYKITVDVIDRQWDQESRTAFASNPSLITGLHADIKSGVFDRVAPAAMKMKVLDGNTKSDIEYYMAAGQQVLSQEQDSANKAEKTVQELNQQGQNVDKEFDQASSEANKKRSASTTRKRSDRKGVIDYLDDDDEEFDNWYKSVMSKV